MNREEFIRLSEKYLSGKATVEEQEQLKAYNDQIQLDNDSWNEGMGDREEIYYEISNAVSSSVAASSRRKRFFRYSFPIAASLLIILSVGMLFLNRNISRNKQITKASYKPVLPAEDKAYLTLSDGKKILLDSTQNNLTTEFGIKLHKEKDGLLVYNLSGLKEQLSVDETLYHVISTPKGGRYSIVLADGSKVWLNASSSIRFPLAFNGHQRKVQLIGEGYFEVAKNKEKPFIVEASGTEVKVLGTHFNVSAYAEDGLVKTTLLEGSVRFEHKGSSVLLTPGYAATAKLAEEDISTQRADIQEAVSWKNGLFIFHDENIAAVAHKISRWYDVEVVLEGDVRDKEFGGAVSRFKEITEILEMMKLAGGINYKIEGRRVTIMN
ncbi:FecR family protein [Desertivirga arenae]|uniref:FecR family protein n=1 Tax=Desertivirga arenae TaxID=2810309 RepID=UPI001A95AA34|nr:FecR family protein [Pedobacter sp. SYSU D00823]